MADILTEAQHWRQFGKKTGKSRAQWKAKYQKYLLSKAETSSEASTLSSEEHSVDDSGGIVIPPKDDEGEYIQHKAFRQMVKGQEEPEVVQQLIRPVYRATGRSLLGTSAKNLGQSLLEKAYVRPPKKAEIFTPPPPPPPVDDIDALKAKLAELEAEDPSEEETDDNAT